MRYDRSWPIAPVDRRRPNDRNRNTPFPDLAAIADLAYENPQFPEPTLRDLVYHAEPRLAARGETIPPNGFAPCIASLERGALSAQVVPHS